MKHISVALAGACALASMAATAANTLHIANNGLDGPGCGTAVAPCRSISAGLAAAAEGDTILVRPGLYGDIDGDGALGAPGEETGNYNGTVYINKRVTVLSTEGAAATFIRGVDSVPIVVYIEVSGVQFGERGAGFSVTGANSFGISNNNMVSGKIAGNIATGQVVGFYIGSSGNVEVSHNTAIGNSSAGIIGATNSGTTGGVFIHDNVVVGSANTTGILASALGAHRVIGNSISGAGIGLQLGVGPTRVSQNFISGNVQGIAYTEYFGDEVPSGTPVVARNTLAGNVNNGVYISHLANYPISLRQNNFLGNGRGCAIGTSANIAIDARQSFWGTASGPGGAPPSNLVCSTFDVVKTTPFATTEIAVH